MKQLLNLLKSSSDIEENIKKHLIESLDFLDSLTFIDFFNNECIIYGSSLINIYNEDDLKPKKFNILCNYRRLKLINRYLMNTGKIKRDIITNKKKYKYIYDFSEDDKFEFIIKIDDQPVKNLNCYTTLKIEEVYFDSLIHIVYPKEFKSKVETIYESLNKMSESNTKIIRKIIKYTRYKYKFIIVDEDKLLVCKRIK